MFLIFRNDDVKFCIFVFFIVSRLIPVDVIWRFMSRFIETKTENYKTHFIVKFHLS